MWLAKPAKNRFRLDYGRLQGQFMLYVEGAWTSDKPQVLISPTAVMNLSQDGRTIEFVSQRGYSQRMLFANMDNERIVGSIEIQASGALIIKNGTGEATVKESWPLLWKSQVVAIIGIRAPAAITFHDSQGDWTGEITWNVTHPYWFIPEGYRKATRAYDIESDESDSDTDDASKAGARALRGKNVNRSESSVTEPNRPASSTPRMMTPEESKEVLNDIQYLDDAKAVPVWAHRLPNGRPFVHTRRVCSCTSGTW